MPSRWAIGEDLIVSYPVGKSAPLYVCAGARVRHEHVFDYRVTRPHKFHGYTQTLWVFQFVESNPELSRTRFLAMIFATAAARLVTGALTREERHIEFAIGQLQGVMQGLRADIAHRDLAGLMQDTA